MIIEDYTAICTVGELAEAIKKKISKKYFHPDDIDWTDFAVIDAQPEDVDDAYNSANGWYGIRRVDTGFDDYENLHLCSDWYGGGCPEIRTFYCGFEDDDKVLQKLLDMIKKTLSVDYTGITDDTLLVAETSRRNPVF